MHPGLPRNSLIVAVAVVVAVLGATAALWHLRSSVQTALKPTRSAAERPLTFTTVPAPIGIAEHWGSGEVLALARTPTGLITAGGSGVLENDQPLAGLPTLRASALALWRGDPTVGLAAGGLFRRSHGEWQEARTGWGVLHVRTLAETPAGELLVGAREGTFRAAVGASTLERLDSHPVRSLAIGSGFLLAGGEEGLYRLEASRTLRLETPDPWVETVALSGSDLLVVTATGVARGPLGAPLTPVSGGEDLLQGTLHDGAFYGTDGRSAAVARVDLGSGRAREEILPAPARHLFASGGEIFADTPLGLARREKGSWVLRRREKPGLPSDGHIGALAALEDHLVVGIFDGGLVLADRKEGSLLFRDVEGSSAWGVNALLSAGGALYVASLRGACRFDGRHLEPLEGPGAAFSLAATPAGVAIGYGEGVLLPGRKLLSAFHGLPGNQALAIASGSELFVGTPSGLGAIDGWRVRWRVGAGEGKLPHPWVTALASAGDGLYVGTYGGGIARRRAGRPGEPGEFEPFVETEGLKINTGTLLEAGGRIWAGTDGSGLYRSSLDRKGFEPVGVTLPSRHITALAATSEGLYVGTDEGLARLPLSDTRSTEEAR